MTRIDEIRERLSKATQRDWLVSKLGDQITQTPYVGEALKRVLCEMVDKTEAHGDAASEAYQVVAGTLPKPGEPDPEDFVTIAFFGNGPTSASNSDLTANAPADIDYLLAEVARLAARRAVVCPTCDGTRTYFNTLMRSNERCIDCNGTGAVMEDAACTQSK